MCDWIPKLGHFHTEDYLRRRKLLIHTTQGMTLKCIVFSGRRQLQKATYCRIPFIWHPGKDKTTVMKSRAVVVKEWEGGQDMTTKGQHKWILGSDETVLYFDCSGGTWLLSKLTRLYNFKKSEFYFMWIKKSPKILKKSRGASLSRLWKQGHSPLRLNPTTV